MKGFRLVAGLLLAAALLAGCPYSGPEVAKPPASPVGTYRQESFRHSLEPRADGEPVLKIERARVITVRVAADHTLRYEWTASLEPASTPGRLEVLWREATAEERAAVKHSLSKWWVFERSEPNRKRGPDDLTRTLIWQPHTWWVPAVDFETGRLTDSYWMVQRTAD